MSRAGLLVSGSMNSVVNGVTHLQEYPLLVSCAKCQVRMFHEKGVFLRGELELAAMETTRTEPMRGRIVSYLQQRKERQFYCVACAPIIKDALKELLGFNLI